MGSEHVEVPWTQTSFLLCDPEPSLIKWAESVKSKGQKRTVIRSSPRRFHQRNGAVENYQKQLQGQVRTMLAALQERTQHRPTTDSALLGSSLGSKGSDVQSASYRAMGGPYRGKLLEFDESVLVHLPEVGKESGNPATKLPDRWKSALWLGKSDLTDEHLVRTDVYARSVRRLAEHSWSEKNIQAIVETLQRPQTTIADIHLFFVSHQKRNNKRTGRRQRDAGGASGHERST